MKTIIIASQKGGSGKTMLSAHLAVEAERVNDAPVYVVDMDRQGTLSRWHERREAETPVRAPIALERMQAGLEALQKKHSVSYCFVDTAPTISDQTARLINFADLVLIPVRPSPSDLWSVVETVELVKEADKPFLFVLTQAKPQATITAQAVAALSQHGSVAQSFIVDRVVYASSMTGGNTAPEVAPRGPAAEEIAALWKEVKSCFTKSMKSGKRVSHG